MSKTLFLLFCIGVLLGLLIVEQAPWSIAFPILIGIGVLFICVAVIGLLAALYRVSRVIDDLLD